MYRLFVAVDLNPEVAKLVHKMSRIEDDAVRWVATEQLHVTLRFLGECDEQQFVAVKMALKDVKLPAFRCAVEGVGFFPNVSRPKVCWLGVRDEGGMQMLKALVDDALLKCGLLDGENRTFQPHLTIARFRKKAGRNCLKKIVETGNCFKAQYSDVNRFILFSSVLTRQGAIHTKEAVYQLD